MNEILQPSIDECSLLFALTACLSIIIVTLGVISERKYKELYNESVKKIKERDEFWRKQSQWNKVIITPYMLFIMDLLLNASNADSLIKLPKNACLEGGATESLFRERWYKLGENDDVDKIYFDIKDNKGSGYISLNVVMLMLSTSNTD